MVSSFMLHRASTQHEFAWALHHFLSLEAKISGCEAKAYSKKQAIKSETSEIVGTVTARGS